MLRSCTAHLLQRPLVLTSVASRAFTVAAPTVCNSLSVNTRSADSFASFKRRLKSWPCPCHLVLQCHIQELWTYENGSSTHLVYNESQVVDYVVAFLLHHIHSCQPFRFWRNFPDFWTLSRHPAREFQNSAFCSVVETLITQPAEFSNCERK